MAMSISLKTSVMSPIALKLNMRFPRRNFSFVSKRFMHEEKSGNWVQPEGFTTDVKIYNSTLKRNVPLILKNDKIATWYMCGPTVYDSSHIGHACTYVRFDIIRRILTKFFDINVVTIMGVTDIDDKIIKRSSQTKQDWKQLTRHYEREFIDEMTLLGVEKPFAFCRVSDYIPQIISFVEQIVNANNAYVGKDGSVYFDTKQYGKYGKLIKALPPEEHPTKKSSTDFALWKSVKPGEPSWESPWGPGRPGWHIECSTIASSVFGKSIDIHSGGIDLLFPHHENEEAQSCCHHNVDQWVNYWLHSGFLHLKGDEKMSKSLKNTVSISDLLKSYSSDQFRLLCLLTRYRTDIEFSHKRMQAAVTILHKLENFLSVCNDYVSGRLNVSSIDENLVIRELQLTQSKVQEALSNDFDTTKAIFTIQDLVSVVHKILIEAQVEKYTSTPTWSIAAVAEYIKTILSNFGFSEQVTRKRESDQLDEIIETFVNFRKIVRIRALESAVKDKDLLRACDDVRNDLSAYGIQIKDHKDTCTWSLMKNQVP